MSSSRPEMSVSINDEFIQAVEMVLTPSPKKKKKTTVFQMAESAEVSLALPKLKEGITSGAVSLDLFTWDVILIGFARYIVANDHKVCEVFRSYQYLRQVLHSNPTYVKLVSHNRDKAGK